MPISFGPSVKTVKNTLTNGHDVKVRITTPGGGTTIATPKVQSGSFNRIIDETSTARIQFIVPGNLSSDQNRDECCQGLEHLNIASQELEISVDGVVAWAGPIQYIAWENSIVTVEAADNTAWWASRVLPSISFLDPKELTEIVRDYHEVAMAINPIPGFNLITCPSEEYADTLISVDDKRTALDAIDELAEFSIDYVALGRSVYVGSPQCFSTLQYELTDNDFKAGLKVEQLGPAQGFATRIIAFGESGNPITVQADTATIASYGVIERVVEFVQLTSRVDLTKAASAYLETFSSPFYISSQSGAALRPGVQLSFEELIPGSLINVAITSTCRPVRQQLRLREVAFDITTGETKISLEPISAEFGNVELAEVVS